MRMRFKYIFIILSSIILHSACTDEWGPNQNSFASSVYRYLMPSANSFTDNAGYGGSTTFKVEATNVPWRFQDVVSWTSLDPMSGSGSSTGVTIRFQENPSTTNSRTGVFYLASAESSWPYRFPMQVSQSRSTPYAYPEKDTLTFSGASSSQQIDIVSNCSFRVSNTYSWITVSNVSQSSLTVTVAANTTNYKRTAYFYLQDSNGYNLYKVFVVQNSATVTTQTKSLNFKNSANNLTLKIDAEASWSASTQSSWIQITPSSGTAGQKEVKVSVTANTSVSQRTGYIYFKINSKEVLSIPVTQDGYFLKTSATSQTFDSVVESKTLSVYSNTSWKVKSKPSWLTITPTTGKDTLSITIKSDENQNVSQRTGEIVFAASQSGLSLETKVSVTQKGKTFTYGKDYIECLDSAQTIKVDIKSNGKWSAYTDSKWITVTPTTATGDAVLELKIAENTGDKARSGIVNLVIGKDQFDITIYQRGKYLIIDKNVANTFTSLGGTLELEISTSDSIWKANVDDKADWVKLSDTLGKGRVAKLNITVSENPTLNQRSSSVTITTSSGRSVKVMLYQNGKYLKVDNSHILFFAKGGQSDPISIVSDGNYTIKKVNGDWFEISDVKSGIFSVTAQENKGKTHREGAVLIEMTGLKDCSLSVQIPVIQTAKGETYVDNVGYGNDIDYDLHSESGISISIVKFGEDKNWDAKFQFKFEIKISGFKEDQNLDHDVNYDQNIDKGDYKEDTNYDN